MKELSEELKTALTTVVKHFRDEDREVRDRQLRKWKRLKLMWEGFSRIYFDEVAHDWRIFEQESLSNSSIDNNYYDKPINILKAYLDSIIAALSITIPPIKCYPDDADNTLDLITARAGDKIAQLIYRHNDIALLWLHSLFITATEGLTCYYTYSKADESYGTYKEDVYEDKIEQIKECPSCGIELPEGLFGPKAVDEFNPSGMESPVSCPFCNIELTGDIEPKELITPRLVETKTLPKSRVCIESYGGLFVKVPIYAKRQEDIPYLGFSYESHYTAAIEQYPDLKDKLRNSSGSFGGYNTVDREARLSTQYLGDVPRETVTCEYYWLRPEALNILSDNEHVTALKKKFPDGVKVVLIDDLFAEACAESLDDHWTIEKNPLADYLHFEPAGEGLVNIQEITNDLISLVLQTIEHGIPQTFADPTVLDFKAYSQSEVMAGGVYPATAKTGKSVGDAFHEVKTATLSQEVLPFFETIQSLGQLVSGALPSLFGGQMEGSKTASEYSMSRAQALQRLQNTWKTKTIAWKKVFAKAIPLYINEMREDEKYVERNKGGFLNIFIRRAELEGKIGRIELEANENLPITWQQQKDTIMQLTELQNPMLMELFSAPENIHLISDAIGIPDLRVPGEDDREKQQDEIKLLINSTPITVPVSNNPLELMEMAAMGAPMEQELPSIEIEPLVDNHNIHAEVCRNYLVSEEGRQLKASNPQGYKNILLHLQMHIEQLAQVMQSQEQPNATGEEGNVAKPKGNATPLKEKSEPNVQA